MIYVRSFLFARLASPCLGHTRTPTVAGEERCAEVVGISSRLRQPKRCLHENQFRESRSRSRINRPSNAVFYRRNHATLQGRFVTLAKRAELDSRKVWMGSWLRGFLGIRVQRSRRDQLYRQTRGTSPKEGLCRGTEIICRTARTGMAERLKPLKRFQVCFPAFTGLKPGVNEKIPRFCRQPLMQAKDATCLFLPLTPGFSQVRLSAELASRLNGLPPTANCSIYFYED